MDYNSINFRNAAVDRLQAGQKKKDSYDPFKHVRKAVKKGARMQSGQ